MAGRMLSSLGALRRDRSGNALVEFAVAFPVLIALYVGSFVLSDAIACNRKVTITARALTDLATRYQSLTQNDATTILNASAQVMSPYAPANAFIVLSEIKVTGIRRSIESSIETKQAATSIVESVSAEDIGKLPDISIAESIARLPGLAAQRVAGRA